MAPMHRPQKNPQTLGRSPLALFSPPVAPSAHSLIAQTVRRIAPVLCALGLLLASSTAEAKLFEVYLDGYVGGMYGTDPKFDSVITRKPDGSTGNDFFRDQSGGVVGGRLGIEILYTDIYLQFDQFLTAQGFSGSTLQPMLGWDLDIDVGNWKGLIGGYGGFVFGFPYTPHYPIDTHQISTVGVTIEGQGGAEYVLNRFLGVQLMATVGYHYMFAGAENVPLTVTGISESTRTHGFHLMFKAGLRLHLGL